MTTIMIHDIKEVIYEKEPHKLSTGSWSTKISLKTTEGYFDIDLFSDNRENLILFKI